MDESAAKGRQKNHHLDAELRLLESTTLHRDGAKYCNKKVCFSFAAYACNVISHLRRCEVPVVRGLSEEEFRHIKACFGLDFPPDLRSILQEGLPVGRGFPDWRSSPAAELLAMIDLPAEGICREVAKGTFWCSRWGDRPHSSQEAVRMARRAIRAAPPLVPIYSHCYIPCSPKLSGNPILFIFEKDVFYCGYDLAGFFGREIFLPAEFPLASLDMQSTVNWSPKRMRSRISAQLEDNGCPTGGREINDGGCHGLTPGERVNLSRSTHEGSRLNQNIYGDPQGHRLRQKNSHEHGHNGDERHLCHADVGAKHDRAVCSESLAPNNGDAFGQCVDQVSCERLAKWDALNRRLLAELESTDKKDGSLAAPRSSLCEEPLHCRESLPRNAARSAGSSPRTSQRIVSRYAYFHQCHLPAKLLSQLTIAAPPWAAKMARYIPMWSDLVESNAPELDNAHVRDVVQLQNPAETLSENASRRNIQAKEKRRSSNGAGSSTRTHESTIRVLGSGNGSDLDRGHSKESDSASPTLLATQENQVGKMGHSNHVCLRLKGEDEGMSAFNKRCLLPYFKDLERRLRNGGWKQVEIEEMIAASLPDDECFSLVETRQGIHNALSRDADLKSMSLRKAGWSRPDVVEILS